MTKWDILVLLLVGFCSAVKEDVAFLDRSNLTISSATEQVSCKLPISTMFSRKSILWQKNGEMVSNETDMPIYQQLYKGDRLITSNIIFVNPQQSDEGEFHCVVYYRSSVTDNLTLHVTVDNFVDWPQRDEYPTKLPIQTRLTFRTRPQPELMWTVNETWKLERYDDAFQHITTYNHTTLTLTQVLVIKNLMYFGADPRFSFSASVNGQVLSFHKYGKLLNTSSHIQHIYSFVLDSGLSDFDGNSFGVQLPTRSEEELREECAMVGGYVDDEAVRSLECRIKAAELERDLERTDEVCSGNSFPLVIDNYVTEEVASYQLLIKRRDDVIRANTHVISSQVHTLIDQLQPRTNYIVEFLYRPKYWREPITIVRNLTTGGEIPVQPTVTRAHLSTRSRTACNFDLDVSSTNDTSQISQIIILQHLSFAHSALMIKQNYSSIKSTYTFQTVSDGDGSDVMFSIQLEGCHGEVGLESMEYSCEAVTADVQMQVTIIAASGSLIFIIIAAISIYSICRRRRMARKSADDGDDIDVEVTGADPGGHYIDLDITHQNGEGNYIDLEIPGPSKGTSLNPTYTNVPHHNKLSPRAGHYENVQLSTNPAIIANSFLRKFKKQ